MDRVDLIDKYFENSLSDEEELLFNEYMAQDIEFAEEVEFQIKTKNAFKHNERRKLKSLLDEIDKANQTTIIQEKKIKPYPFYYIAASVAIVIGISYVLYTTLNKSNNPINIDFIAYYTPYPNIIEPVTRNNNDSLSAKSEAFYAYEQALFQSADTLFNALINDQEFYPFFYKGIVKIELEDYDSAIYFFNKYIETDESLLLAQSHWNKALSHIALVEYTQAKNTLNKLLEEFSYKQQESIELLEKLNESL